jgi:hypothetical protein
MVFQNRETGVVTAVFTPLGAPPLSASARAIARACAIRMAGYCDPIPHGVTFFGGGAQGGSQYGASCTAKNGMALW